ANCDSYAIQVELTRETCSSIILNIAALFGRGSSNNTNGLCYEPINLVRSAVAALPPQYVSFSASSTLLRLCSNEAPASQPLLQPLMQLLSSEELCVALIGSQGIVDANISLLELREGMALLDTDASLGTLDDLLSSDLNIGNLIDIFLAAANSDSEHLALLDLNE